MLTKSVLREAIKDLIRNDVETRGVIKNIIREVEKEKTLWFIKSFGGLIFKGLIALLSIAATLFVMWLSKKLGLN